MRSAFLIVPLMVMCSGAQAQDVRTAPSHPVIEIPASRAAGTVSRYQRQVIVPGGGNNPHASPASQYFDDVMDHLELLMADEIRKNNEIALLQEKVPGYKF